MIGLGGPKSTQNDAQRHGEEHHENRLGLYYHSQGMPAAGRGKEGFSPEVFGVNTALQTL